MILTLTPNPSIDFTLVLTEALRPGAVQRAAQVSNVAGGKGINVSQACVKANVNTLALFPCSPTDPFMHFIKLQGIPHRAVTIPDTVRTNTTVTSPTGETTKLNGPGPQLTAETLAQLQHVLLDAAPTADAVVLAGSLPQGTPTDWYVSLIRAMRSVVPHVPIAIDTSDSPLRAIYEGLELGVAPDIVKPNGVELGQMLNIDGEALEDSAANGDFAPIVAAARILVSKGIPEVLVSLGAAGAVLVTADTALHATPPPITCVSTVGAGDSTLASFVLSRHVHRLPLGDSLRNAVAYGAAAASLPGTAIPSPDQVNPQASTLQELNAKEPLS
ncbi:MAG: 1-phosphofructokinase family hexose kinase [Corynebacterium sp.]|nr:1-phosphofructokinase family hexose kinase [Corynebacterium sp.]